MKKCIFLVLALLLVLTGCGDSTAPVETAAPTEPMETAVPAPSPEASAALCPYDSLTFSGCDVNPQQYSREYTTTDTELISAVWDLINSPGLGEVSDYKRYESSIHLVFMGKDTPWQISIQANDYGLFRVDGDLMDEGVKYALAPGSYAAVSTLLTEYTAENYYNFTIDESFLSVDTGSAESLEFQRGAEDKVFISPAETGEFTQGWALTPSDIMNHEYSERPYVIRNIRTKAGIAPVEVNVYPSELLIYIGCDGIGSLFSTDQSTADSVVALFDSVCG